jgi:hypothetical protein
MDDAPFGTSGAKEVLYENTYITEPDGYGSDAKFQRHKVCEWLGVLAGGFCGFSLTDTTTARTLNRTLSSRATQRCKPFLKQC